MDSLALANAQRNLEKAYKNFFRNKAIGFPKFKSKKNPVQSYTTNNQKGTITIFENWVKLPKLKEVVKMKAHRNIEGIMKSATILRNGSGKYFISLLCEMDIQELAKTNASVGMDIIKNHNIICMEDLNTKGLLRNHQLAKFIAGVSWASFVNKLEYKAKWYGKEIIKVDRVYLSSQIQKYTK